MLETRSVLQQHHNIDLEIKPEMLIHMGVCQTERPLKKPGDTLTICHKVRPCCTPITALSQVQQEQRSPHLGESYLTAKPSPRFDSLRRKDFRGTVTLTLKQAELEGHSQNAKKNNTGSLKRLQHKPVISAAEDLPANDNAHVFLSKCTEQGDIWRTLTYCLA